MMMRKLLINTSIIASFCLTGCSTAEHIGNTSDSVLPGILPHIDEIPGVYRIPIQQGNLITQEMINELKPGMTKRQVRYLLGTPLLVDTFRDDRWDYVYVHRPASDAESTEVEQRQLKLFFANDRLQRVIGDMYPQGEALAKMTKEENRERTLIVPADAPRYNEDTGIFETIVNKVIGDDEPVAQKRPVEESAEATDKPAQ